MSKPYTPPHSNKAEQSLLGALLIDCEAIGRVVETGLKAADFYHRGHENIFRAALGLYQDQNSVDVLMLSEALRKQGSLEEIGGYAYLSELSDAVATAANIEHHAQIIQTHSARRRLLEIGREIVEQNSDGRAWDLGAALERAEKAILGLRSGRERKGLERIDIRPTIEQIERRYKDPDAITGLQTGFYGLDKLTGGLQQSDLIILAGRPGQGL
jgi:replicative DNA helicase